MPNQKIYQRVEQSIAQIRPYLQNDGGDISLESISDDMVVTVKLHGACSACSFSSMTMQNGVIETIMRDVPEVSRVVALND